MVGRALKEMTPLGRPGGDHHAGGGAVRLRAVPGSTSCVGLLILGVFGVGVGALSYALAIAARKTEWIFWAVQQSLLFPLLILSA